MSSQRVTISQQSQHIYMGLGCPVRGSPSVSQSQPTFIWDLDVQSEGYHQSTEPTHLYGTWMSSQRVTISQQSQHIYMGLGCPVRGLPSVNRANTFIWDLDVQSEGYHQSTEPTHLYGTWTWMSSQRVTISQQSQHIYMGLGCPVRGLPSVNRANTFIWDLDVQSEGYHQSTEPTHLYRTWMSSQGPPSVNRANTFIWDLDVQSEGYHQSTEPTHLYRTWMSSQRVTISQQSQHIYIGLGCPVRGLPSVNRANTFIWDLDVQSEGYHQSTEPTHLYGTWMSSQRVTISQQSQHIYMGLGCPVRGLPSVNRANTFIWDLDVQSEGYHQSTEPTHLYGTWMSSQRVTISQQSQHIYMGLGCPVRGLPSVNRANTFIWDLDVQSEGYHQSTEPTHLYGTWMSSQRVTISQQSQHIYMGLGCPVRGLPSVNRANTFIWDLDVQSEGYHQSTEPTHLYRTWMSSQRVTISQQSQHIYMGLGCPVRGLPSVNRANTFIWDLDVQSEGYHQSTEPTHLYGTWMSSQRVTISQQSQHIYMGLGCPVRVLPSEQSQHIYMGLGCPVRGLPSVNRANTFIWDLDVQSEGYHQSTEPTHLYRTWMSSQRVTISQQSQHIYIGLGCPVRGLPSVNRANTFIWDLDVQSECYHQSTEHIYMGLGCPVRGSPSVNRANTFIRTWMSSQRVTISQQSQHIYMGLGCPVRGSPSVNRANTFIWDLDVQSEGHHQSTEPTHLYRTWMSSQRFTISQQSQHIYMGLGCPVRGLPSVNRANTFIWDLDVQSEGYHQSTEPTHLYGTWMSSQRVTISQQSQHIYMGLGCPVRGLPSVNRANTFIWDLDVQSEGYHQSTEPTHLYGTWMSSQRVTISQQSQHIYMGLGCPVRGLPSVNRANTFI